jgi:hypothetical protein
MAFAKTLSPYEALETQLRRETEELLRNESRARREAELLMVEQERIMREMEIRARDVSSYAQQQFVSNSSNWMNSLNSLSNALGGLGAFGTDRPSASNQLPVPPKPEASIIKTSALPEVDMENERVSLALEAEDLLGYTPLRKDVKAPSRLHRVLAALDIQILDKDDVGSYKIKMQQHHQAIATNENKSRTKIVTVAWKMIPLKEYKKPIPEFVLRKCTQIKREIPEATFLVDELTREERTVDPFMIVSLAGDKKTFDVDNMAYLEVWDEAEFEKTV